MNIKNIVFVLGVLFCIGGLIVGITTAKKEEAAAKVKQEQQKKQEQQATKEREQAYEEEEETPPPPIEEGKPEQDENFSKEDLEQSQKIAIEFAKTFHTYDAAKPFQNLENSKQYMSNDLYLAYQKNPSRGTLDAVKKKPLDINVTTTANTSLDKIVWNVIVQSENTDNDGNKHLGEDWYLVELKKVDNQFQVTGVSVNAAH